jgi:hypothetical protein
MIRSHRSLINLIAGVILFSAVSLYAHAQENAAKPNAEEIAALREKAFKLLDNVAGQLTTLQSTENRARMGANIADSLWKHDEERARSLLRMVQEDIKTELHKPDKERLDHARFAVFLKLRHDTVERIAKHDGQAAFDFLKVTYPLFEEDDEAYSFRNNEQALELRLAKQIAANNPDAALKLARQALEQGFNNDLLSLLAKLNRKHKDQAQVLYKEIVDKLRDAELMSDWSTAQFAQTLIQAYQPPDADASTYRDAVGIVITMALARGCEKKKTDDYMRSEFCEWAATVLVPVERYDSRIAKIKHWETGTNYESLRYILASEEARELMQEGAFNEVEILAAKYPEMQVGFYQQAILQAILTGEKDKARHMIDRFPGDPERKKELLAQLETIEKKAVPTDEQLAAIKKRTEELPNERARAHYLLSVANQFANDQKLAMKFLEQAAEAIDSMKPGKEQTEVRLGLALLYSVLKSDRGFTIMESLVPKLNELVEVAVKLDGYDTNYLRDGEWNMSANGSLGQILTILSQSAGNFAWCDFDRAVSLASQFERPEIRMMAHLKLAQSILGGSQRPRTRFYVDFR